MIPEARNVRLKPKIREALEARRRAATTAQRDVRRARIVLLAAQGRSTRSIAEEVGVQPRFVSNWRRRFAEHGLGGLKDRPRGSRKRIYGKATNQRILALLDQATTGGICAVDGSASGQDAGRHGRSHRTPRSRAADRDGAAARSARGRARERDHRPMHRGSSRAHEIGRSSGRAVRHSTGERCRFVLPQRPWSTRPRVCEGMV